MSRRKMKGEEQVDVQPVVIDETLFSAFLGMFSPAELSVPADEYFTDSDLRRLLSAYVPFGGADPLPEVKRRLSGEGFQWLMIYGVSPVLVANRRRNGGGEADFTHLLSGMPVVDDDILRLACELESAEGRREEGGDAGGRYIEFTEE